MRPCCRTAELLHGDILTQHILRGEAEVCSTLLAGVEQKRCAI